MKNIISLTTFLGASLFSCLAIEEPASSPKMKAPLLGEKKLNLSPENCFSDAGQSPRKKQLERLKLPSKGQEKAHPLPPSQRNVRAHVQGRGPAAILTETLISKDGRIINSKSYQRASEAGPF